MAGNPNDISRTGLLIYLRKGIRPRNVEHVGSDIYIVRRTGRSNAYRE